MDHDAYLTMRLKIEDVSTIILKSRSTGSGASLKRLHLRDHVSYSQGPRIKAFITFVTLIGA